jgi:hypothetical protein
MKPSTSLIRSMNSSCSLPSSASMSLVRQPRNGKGDAYAYCKACHPGAIERLWTRERVLAAMVEWRERYGALPSSYDWSRTYARRRGGEAQAARPRRVAVSERGQREVRDVGGSAYGGERSRERAARLTAGTASLRPDATDKLLKRGLLDR